MCKKLFKKLLLKIRHFSKYICHVVHLYDGDDNNNNNCYLNIILMTLFVCKLRFQMLKCILTNVLFNKQFKHPN